MAESPDRGHPDDTSPPPARRWPVRRLIGAALLLAALGVLLWQAPREWDSARGLDAEEQAQSCNPRALVARLSRAPGTDRSSSEASSEVQAAARDERESADSRSRASHGHAEPGTRRASRQAGTGAAEHNRSERPCRVVGDLLGPEEPVRSARVILQRAKLERPPPAREQQVRLNDTFRFEGLETGLYVVYAEAPDLSAARYPELLECQGEGEQFEVRLALQPLRGTLRGEVTDTEGEPIADVKVRYYSAKPFRPGPPVAVDALGRFTIGFSDVGTTYEVIARAQGYMESDHEVISREGEQHLFLRMEPEALVHGVVIGPRGPLADVLVGTAAPRAGKVPTFGTTTSERDGSFVVPAMPQGGWLVARHQGLFGRLRLEPFEPGHDLHRVQLRLSPGRVVRATVVDARRRPLPDQLCYSWLEDVWFKTETRSDAEGRFEATALPPDWNVHIGCFIDDTVMPPELEQLAPPGIDEVVVVMPATPP